jgi:hypothetical protein
MALLVSPPVHAQQPSKEFDGPGYRVMLANGITGTTEPKVDFEITTFRKNDGTVLLSAYSGLHPNFNERGSRVDKFNGLHARRIDWTNSEKQTCAEVLVRIRGTDRFNFSVHFLYCLSADADVKQAESIIRSIRPEP